MPAKEKHLALGQRVLPGGLCRPSRRELGGLIFFVTFLHQGKKVKKKAARRRRGCGLRKAASHLPQAASHLLCSVLKVATFKLVTIFQSLQQFSFYKNHKIFAMRTQACSLMLTACSFSRSLSPQQKKGRMKNHPSVNDCLLLLCLRRCNKTPDQSPFSACRKLAYAGFLL
jgi:hypothetical protein